MFKGRKAFGSVLAAVLITAAVIACVVVASGAAFKVLTLGTRQPTASLEALKAVHAAVEEVAFKPGATATVKIVTDEPITIGPDAIRLNTPLTEPPSLPDPKGIVKSVDRYGLTYENVRFTENRGFYGLATLTLICLKVEQGTAVIGYEPTGTVTAQLNALRIAVTTIGPGEGGTTSPQPGTYFYAAGSVKVNVEAYANQGYRFKHWLLDGSVAGTASSITVTVDGDHVLEAVFVKLWTLSISVQPEGWGTTNPAPGTYTYEHGSQVAVTAIPYATYYFKEWILDGASSGSQNPISVTMDGDHSLTAVFVKRYALTVTAGQGGSVVVEGTRVTGTQTLLFDAGRQVTLTAHPDQGYRLLKWVVDGSEAGSDTSITVTMDKDHAVQAVFIRQYRLTIRAGGGGHTDPSPGTYTYDAGTTVTVTATPNAGYRLKHWKLDGSVRNENPISVRMDRDHDLEAFFVRVWTLTVEASNGGTTDPAPGTYTYDDGSTATVKAIPSQGWGFVNWILDGSQDGSQNPISIRMDRDHTLKPVFRSACTLTITVTGYGTTNPAPGTYQYQLGSIVVVKANSNPDRWVLDGNPYSTHLVEVKWYEWYGWAVSSLSITGASFDPGQPYWSVEWYEVTSSGGSFGRKLGESKWNSLNYDYRWYSGQVYGGRSDRIGYAAKALVRFNQPSVTVTITTDDGMEVWIDGQQVFGNSWRLQSPTTYQKGVSPTSVAVLMDADHALKVVFPEEDQRAKAKLYSLLGSGANQILRSYAVVGYEEGSVNVPSLYAYAYVPHYDYTKDRFYPAYAEVRTPDGTFTQTATYWSTDYVFYEHAEVSRRGVVNRGPLSVGWSASASAYKLFYPDWPYYDVYQGETASVGVSVKFKPSSQGTYILVIPKSQADRFGGVQGAQVINGYYVLQAAGDKTIIDRNLSSTQSAAYSCWGGTMVKEPVSVSIPSGPLNVYAFKVVPR